MNRVFFNIPIGDWSGDGHGRCRWILVSTAKTLADVREAYFNAKKLIAEELHPEEICDSRQGVTIAKTLAESIRQMSGICLDGHSEDDGEQWAIVRRDQSAVYVDRDDFIDYVIWFINRGNASVDVKLEEQLDMLPFYGYDKHKRHIGYIGYGLASD